MVVSFKHPPNEMVTAFSSLNGCSVCLTPEPWSGERPYKPNRGWKSRGLSLWVSLYPRGTLPAGTRNRADFNTTRVDDFFAALSIPSNFQFTVLTIQGEEKLKSTPYFRTLSVDITCLRTLVLTDELAINPNLKAMKLGSNLVCIHD